MSKYTRNCPLCNKELTYSSKYNYQKAKLKKSKCKSCGIKESITDERREKMRDRVEGRNNPMFGMKGELNPFFGKKHTEETKIKIVINRDMSVYRSDEFRKKMSEVTKGENNPMFGRSFYDVWVERYGKQLADEKMKKYRETQSINNSGTKNNMFGKPSPIGSGNGWSGWYKGWYFRSLKELTYMIKVIERYNLEWESAETKDLTIRYLDYNLIERSYTADFIVNNRYMVEIKPKKLWDSPLIKLKTGAAIEFCNLRGLKYKLIDIDRLSNQEIITLLDNNLIKFIDRYHNMLNNP
jgi:hypothetical protein